MSNDHFASEDYDNFSNETCACCKQYGHHHSRCKRLDGTMCLRCEVLNHGRGDCDRAIGVRNIRLDKEFHNLKGALIQRDAWKLRCQILFDILERHDLHGTVHPNIVTDLHPPSHTINEAARATEKDILTTPTLQASDTSRATFLQRIHNAINTLSLDPSETLFNRYTLSILLIRTSFKAFISTDIRSTPESNQECEVMKQDTELRKVVRALDKQFVGILREGETRGEGLPMEQVRALLGRCEMAEFYPKTWGIVEEGCGGDGELEGEGGGKVERE